MKITRLLPLFCVALLVCQFVQAAEPLNEKLGKIFSNIGNNDTEEFLDPDQAFIFTADVTDPHHLKLHWDIADGYYLYQNRFKFSLDDKRVIPGQATFPDGKTKTDPEFGDVVVYFNSVDITLPLKRQELEELPLNLSVVYQGCKDGEICYPPINKSVPLVLPVATELAGKTAGQVAGDAQNGTMVSSQDAISNSLKKGSVLINMLVFFGFGLLLALTPCIFPMIPILSGIIIGQSDTITPYRGFLLSLVYVVTMALTYAVLGIVAGSFQINIQAASQNVWVISIFSLIFVLLALSMFGLYELQLPVSWQDRLTSLSRKQQRGKLIGAAIMGILSAVIVGPCVAPPLAGALIYISQTGNALLGGAALFALGMGMGMPLIVIGTSAGKLLPRAGNWMVTIKKIFGVIMLGVAIWFLSRVLPGPVTLVLWGALLIITSLYIGVFDRLETGSTWKKLWKGVGIVFLVYGITLVLGAAGGSKDIFRPLQGVLYQAEEAHRLPFRKIKSSDDLDNIIAEADWQNKVVMLDFYADWCITCKEMERYTFPDQSVQAALKDVMLLQADVTENDKIDQALMHRFEIIGPPAILFFVRGQERREYRLVGFVKPGEFVTHVHKVSAL